MASPEGHVFCKTIFWVAFKKSDLRTVGAGTGCNCLILNTRCIYRDTINNT